MPPIAARASGAVEPVADREISREWSSGPGKRARRELQELLDDFVASRPELAVLDAGCGSTSPLALPAEARRTGIDVSARQLERNEALHERILGDIQERRLPAGQFDVVVCWTVLEHLTDPRRALDNLVAALAPEGLLVIGVPNLLSPKGLLTKFTPQQAHVWFYKNILKSPGAGHDDVGPFPTYHRMAISPPGLRRYAAQNNLTLLHFDTYESAMQRRERARRGVAGAPWRMIRAATIAATFGVIDPAATEVAAVMQKPAT